VSYMCWFINHIYISVLPFIITLPVCAYLNYPFGIVKLIYIHRARKISKLLLSLPDYTKCGKNDRIVLQILDFLLALHLNHSPCDRTS